LQGIFGCNILDQPWKPFNGTLFRLPFRTDLQAQRSEICKEPFSALKREDFVRNLMTKAGNLMLFLQHVQRVELHRLPRDSLDPSQTELLMTLSKDTKLLTSAFGMRPGSGILDHFSKALQESLEELKGHTSDVVEIVSLSIKAADRNKSAKVKTKSKRKATTTIETDHTCHFRVAWTTGKTETLDLALGNQKEGFVPLAAVALPLDVEGHVMTMEQCPEGK
jgi:hypothetical protein